MIYSNPYNLTHLFVDTFERVAQRFIESAGLEDNACHGIITAIVDECSKHNSFSYGQKARVAGFKQYLIKEQKARAASFRQHLMKEQKARMPAGFKQKSRQILPQRVTYGNTTIGPGSASTSDEEEQRQQTYREYSLLGPGMTFELPCLRAMAAATEKPSRCQASFFGSF